MENRTDYTGNDTAYRALSVTLRDQVFEGRLILIGAKNDRGCWCDEQPHSFACRRSAQWLKDTEHAAA